MYIENGCVEDCQAQYAAMNDAEIVGQMQTILGGTATLKRLQCVGINAVNVAHLLQGFKMATHMLNRIARERGIPVQMDE